ncbi:hypothetical protein BCV70DRAFT_235930 [Testicularia cyperi]|uniref:JmjC domain-containing protein n=1 Tax=Testicularia cyperi TaxID=1882483 RepID=A0A317XX00_9BASI|nr:hypothetical protein BCV70DRAFT_235930 [Testicularia cyperi]
MLPSQNAHTSALASGLTATAGDHARNGPVVGAEIRKGADGVAPATPRSNASDATQAVAFAVPRSSSDRSPRPLSRSASQLAQSSPVQVGSAKPQAYHIGVDAAKPSMPHLNQSGRSSATDDVDPPELVPSMERTTIPDALRRLSGNLLTSDPSILTQVEHPSKKPFMPVRRIDVTTLSAEALGRIIEEHVDESGLPLVICGLDRLPNWDAGLFEPEAYRNAVGGPTSVQVRELYNWSDSTTSLDQFLEFCQEKPCYQRGELRRLYGKDLYCPRSWEKQTAELVHPRLVYHGDYDLAASLAENARPDTLMCYYGPGGTFTPLHRDLCSSLGQNLMVWADPDASSTWLISRTNDSDEIDEHIRSLGGDPDSEGFAPHPDDLRDAPYDVYHCEQKIGDLVLIPNDAVHMVINNGGRTMKVAWSRLTINALEDAVQFVLPLYQRKCRKESYRIRCTVETTLQKLTKDVKEISETPHKVTGSILSDFRRILSLYDQIVCDEFAIDWRNYDVIGTLDSYVECDFCGADVLHGYFECPEGDTICAMCYAQGRLCPCTDADTQLRPCQLSVPFDKRLEIRNEAAVLLKSLTPADSEEPPIEPLAEKEIAKTAWPHSFMAACKLYKIRMSSGNTKSRAPCKLCNASLDSAWRYKCRPCNAAYCYACMLHKFKIHPVHILAQNNPAQLHTYHEQFSVPDYLEWKEDPIAFVLPARAHFTFIEAAITHVRCIPQQPACRIGFLDATPQFPTGLTGTVGNNVVLDTSTHATMPPNGKMKRSSHVTETSSTETNAPSAKRRKLPTSKETSPTNIVMTAASPTSASTAVPTVAEESTASPSLQSTHQPASSEKDTRTTLPLPPLKVQSAASTPSRPPSSTSTSSTGATAGSSTFKLRISNGKARAIGPASNDPLKPSSKTTNVQRSPATGGVVPAPTRHSREKPPSTSSAKPPVVSSNPIVISSSPSPSIRSSPPVSMIVTETAAALRDGGVVAGAVESTPPESTRLLPSLETNTLRVLTEILSIFRVDVNQKAAERQDELLREMRAAEERAKKRHGELVRDMQKCLAGQQQLSEDVKRLTEQLNKPHENGHGANAETKRQLDEISETLADLAGDVMRGARAHLEQQNRSGAGSAVASVRENPDFHPTSSVRTRQ